MTRGHVLFRRDLVGQIPASSTLFTARRQGSFCPVDHTCSKVNLGGLSSISSINVPYSLYLYCVRQMQIKKNMCSYPCIHNCPCSITLSLSSVLFTGRLFGRITQKQPNKKYSGGQICGRILAFFEQKGPNFIKFCIFPLLLGKPKKNYFYPLTQTKIVSFLKPKRLQNVKITRGRSTEQAEC